MDLSEYRRRCAAATAPTGAQVRDFADYVARKHSWYKHLPLSLPGSVFVVFLNPAAGQHYTLDPDGRFTWKDIVKGELLLGPQIPTVEYREKYGFLDVIELGRQRELRPDEAELPDTGVHVVFGGEERVLPMEAVHAGWVELTGVVDERSCQGFLWTSFFQDGLDANATGPDARILQELRRMHEANGGHRLGRSELDSVLFPERERQREALREAARNARALVFG